MLYKELSKDIDKDGFYEAGRFKTERLEIASIADQHTPIIIPFAFPNKAIILENGDESDIDDEVVDSLKRWIEKQKKRRH